MKIKNVVIISLVFFVLSFAVSLIVGAASSDIPELISSTVKSYKFLCGLRVFCDFIPAIAATAFLLGFCFDFGKDYHGSLERFSQAMLSRYRILILTSLIFVFILTIVAEVIFPSVNRKIRQYEDLPKLQREYKNFAKNLYANERYDLAFQFAKFASELNPSDSESIKLMEEAEIAADRFMLDFDNVSNSSGPDISKLLLQEQESISIQKSLNSKTPRSEPYKLLLSANECYEKGDYFGAHYYAQEALKISNAKDVNYEQYKQIAAEAWNKISQARFEGTTEEQKIFAKKYEGFVSLSENDNLHAYYIFKTLSETSKALSIDPDVVRYLRVAETRLENQYFFTDETMNLQNFEDAHNVYFKIEHKDKSSDIYFIKGITSTGTNKNLAQYLRGLSIFSLDENGNYVSGSYTTYAKMTEIPTNIFDDKTKLILEIDKDTATVPYILLKSIDRKKEGIINSAKLEKGETQFTQKGYIILPIKYADFISLKEVSDGIESMNISSLYSFLKIAESYGYSSEVYGQALLNRTFYPIFLLICFVLLGIASWHARLPPNSMFKFKWIFVFPILGFVLYELYLAGKFFFKLLNYSILAISNSQFAILSCLMFYVVILVIVSIWFFACKNSMTTEN